MTEIAIGLKRLNSLFGKYQQVPTLESATSQNPPFLKTIQSECRFFNAAF